MYFGIAAKAARRYWKNIGEFWFSHHDRNVYIIKFEREADKKFLLQKKYTSFNGYLALLHHWDPLVDVDTLNWNLIGIQFEIRNLPQEYQTRPLAERLGGFVGTVLDVDPPNGIPTTEKKVTVTALVTVDTPWRKSMTVERNNGAEAKIVFYYLNPPFKLCPHCYVVNHNKNQCADIANQLKFESNQLNRFFKRPSQGASTSTSRSHKLLVSVCASQNTESIIESEKDVAPSTDVRGSKRLRMEDLHTESGVVLTPVQIRDTHESHGCNPETDEQ
ncbi:hypothetical protein MKW92_000845, partial [Papaver armeniacum]